MFNRLLRKRLDHVEKQLLLHKGQIDSRQFSRLSAEVASLGEKVESIELKLTALTDHLGLYIYKTLPKPSVFAVTKSFDEEHLESMRRGY